MAMDQQQVTKAGSFRQRRDYRNRRKLVNIRQDLTRLSSTAKHRDGKWTRKSFVYREPTKCSFMGHPPF